MRLESRKDVEDYLSGDRIQCLICGKWYKQLPVHLSMIHGVSTDEYKDRFNIPWGRGLVSQSTKEKLSIVLKNRLVDENDSMRPISNENRCLNLHTPAKKLRDYEITRFKKLQKELAEERRKKGHSIVCERLKNVEKEVEMGSISKIPKFLIYAFARNKYPDIEARYKKLKSILKKKRDGKSVVKDYLQSIGAT